MSINLKNAASLAALTVLSLLIVLFAVSFEMSPPWKAALLITALAAAVFALRAGNRWGRH